NQPDAGGGDVLAVTVLDEQLSRQRLGQALAGAKREVDAAEGLAAEDGDGVLLDEATVAEDGDAVAEGLDLAEGVAGEEDCAALGSDAAEFFEEGAADEGIESGGGLVEDEQGRT